MKTKPPSVDPGLVLSVETDAVHADAVARRAQEAWHVQPVQLLRPEAPRAIIELYLPDAPPALLMAEVLRTWPQVHACQVRGYHPRDWLSFWKKHFKPRLIGRRLQVVPIWSRMRPRPRRKLIRINPGMSFGTGEHFTTRFCLEMLDQFISPTRPWSLADIGTGSGLLAIAAVKLGCPRVWACDHDPQALAQAAENCRLNRVSRRVRLEPFDVLAGAIPRTYDVICANLFADLLMRAAHPLWAAGQRFFLFSGIRECEVDAVAAVYTALGAEEIIRDGDGEWCGLVFEKPAPRHPSAP